MARYMASRSEAPPRAVQDPTIYAAVQAFKVFVELIIGWQERASERCRLAQLDRRMLDDMGLDRDAVRHESQKPFWRS